MKLILDKFNLRVLYCGILLATIAFFSLFAFAAYPAADDYFAMTILKEGGADNLFQAIIVGIEHSINYVVNRIDGTFAHFIIRTLVPAYFSLTLHRIALFLLYWFFVSSIYIFMKTLSKHIFNFDRYIVPCVSLTIAFLTINGTPSIATTFFWWSGAINYPLIFSSILCLLAIITDLYYNDKLRLQCKIIRHFLAFCLISLINGSQTSGALFLNCVLILICTLHTWNSIRGKPSGKKVFLYIYIALSVFLILVNVYGTAGRLGVHDGLSVPHALTASLSQGFRDLFNYHHGFTLLLLLMTAPVIAANIPNNKIFHFKHPILASIIAFALFASLHMPIFFGGGNLFRPDRVIGFQYHISYILVFLWFYYIVGYLVAKDIVPIKIKKKHKFLLIIFVCILLVSSTHLPPIRSGNFASGIRELQSGEIRQYSWIRNQRIAIFSNDNVRSVEVSVYPTDLVVLHREVMDIPYLITVFTNWYFNAIQHIYDLDFVRATNNLGNQVFRVISHPIYDIHISPISYETEQLIKRFTHVGGQLVDINGRLPLSPDGEASEHDNVRVFLHSDCGEQRLSYHVHPLVLMDGYATEQKQTINTSFTTSIDFQHIQDASLQMFLVQEHEGNVRYIFQGVITIYGGEITFISAVVEAE